MNDTYNRNINYMRISVTDRCNLRCIYCMSGENIEIKPRSEILTYEEITEVASMCVRDFGIRKIRVTGGEPLVRPHIERLIAKLANIDYLEEITITTNGVLLSEKAKLLKASGINRINISLDTLNSGTFAEITGKDELHNVIKSIDTSLELGFYPIKLNTVVMAGINDNELADILKFAINRGLQLRFIECMNMAHNSGFYLSNRRVMELLEKDFEFTDIVTESRISKEYNVNIKGDNKKILLSFISPLSEMFCNKCNRIRMTSTGEILSCLMDSKYFSIRDYLREGDLEAVRKVIERAIKEKPFHHRGHGYIPMYATGG